MLPAALPGSSKRMILRGCRKDGRRTFWVALFFPVRIPEKEKNAAEKDGKEKNIKKFIFATY